MSDQTKEGVVIDPADNAPYILNKCSELGITLTAVLLTHGHFDHIMAVPDVIRAFRVKLYAYEAEENMLADTKLNMTGGLRGPLTSLHADSVLLHDGQELELLGTRWKALFTPGHTAGSCSFFLICRMRELSLQGIATVPRFLRQDGPGYREYHSYCQLYCGRTF